MKILIQHKLLNNEISGVSTYINFLAQELKNRGMQVKIISIRQSGVLEWLRQIIWADIVHMNSKDTAFALLSKLLGKKIIIKYHWPYYLSTYINSAPLPFWQRIKAEFLCSLPKANYPLRWKLYPFVNLYRQTAFFLTAFLADAHQACSLATAQAVALPWPVQVSPYPIRIIDREKKTSAHLSSPFTFIFVGRLISVKGVDILLRAAGILHQHGLFFRILIVGSGEDEGKMKKLAEQLGLREVEFLGRVPAERIPHLIRPCLALVAPSRWNEAFNYSIIEAASAGTVSIVSKMGGMSEAAGPGGFFFNNEDPVGLSEILEYCLKHPEEALRRGEESKEYAAKHFSPEPIVDNFVATCRKLLSRVKRNINCT